MKKLLSILLTLSILTSMCVILLSCNTPPEPPSTDSNPQESDTTADSDTEPIIETVSFSVNDFKSFVVIRPETASDTFKSTVNTLRSAIEEHIGVALDYRDDYVMEDVPMFAESEYEILVGKCARDEVETYYSSTSLRALDCGYAIAGTKILILGITDESVTASVDLFIGDILKNAPNDSSESLIDSAKGNKLIRATYPVDSLSINGTNIQDYKIVYSGAIASTGILFAEELQAFIKCKTGYIIPVVKDTKEEKSAHELRVGKTNRDTDIIPTFDLGENQYTIHPDENGILFYANNDLGVYNALVHFNGMLSSSDTTLALELNSSVIDGNEDNSVLRVMSFNILTTAPDDARRNRVKSAILLNTPAIVGLQEASPYWMSLLRTDLSSVYSCVGVGRDGGDMGEYNPIFYRHDIYNLLDSGTKWLSDTPDTVSRYEESSYNRIFTYAFLEDKITKDKFLFINTHLEHTNNEARVRQTKVLLQFVSEYISEYKIIITGDFNCQPIAEPYKMITTSGFSSSAEIAISTDSSGTFVGGSKVIDHIFISNDDAIVFSYDVLTEKIDGEDASDHYPIIADLMWKIK
ncbi:MAG: endonuclease/exonuclease/phosphatase family protein [Clostridia bacterium]|nr:endonuclease/exonuclease/phosphatase family protein [Clostridia bacterium]